ncbi:hypothetical protein [Salipiger abyssi]|uniref:hypothetical protein n=1 Tax=Salipiger abyssi TaxID=1250539 RepID=UPI001A8C1580|nr:hypothetical protein [Salipiger abyssi]MBN9887179.1 hypothetical protein [Salipiger abyssi]
MSIAPPVTATPSSPGTALWGETLFGAPCMVKLDAPLSFQPKTATGWMPFNFYALRDGDDLMLIDTGVTVQEPGIRALLERIVPGATRRRLLATRREPDTTMNLPWLVADYGISAVHTAGDLNPLDFFAQMEDAAAAAQIHALTKADFCPMPADAVMDVGSSTVALHRTTLRVLSAAWVYHDASRTLFTSDFFGFLLCDSPDAPTVVTPTADQISPERQKAFICAKFDWLIGIDTTPMIAELKALMDGPPIDRICPEFGCVIEGAEAVRMVIESCCVALEELSRETFPNALGDFIDRFGPF